MIGVYDYTVIATYLATVLGVCGMLQTIEGRPMAAIFCLLAAGLLDTVDGRIARTKKNRTDTEKRFGIQIDSLNDVMCFGALPALIAYRLCSGWLGEVPVWFSATLAFFVLTGLIRLAYFNVTEEERQQATNENRAYYLGLPITSSTLFFPLLYLVTLLPSGGAAAAAMMAVGLFIIGVCYIAPIRIRKPHLPGLVAMGIIGAVEIVVLIVTALR